MWKSSKVSECEKVVKLVNVKCNTCASLTTSAMLTNINYKLNTTSDRKFTLYCLVLMFYSSLKHVCTLDWCKCSNIYTCTLNLISWSLSNCI